MSTTRLLLPELLRAALGSSVTLLGSEILKRNDDYLVLLATLGPPRSQVVVKLAGPHAALGASFDRAAQLHRIVHARGGIPVAEVLAADVSYRRFPWGYLISTYIPGAAWSVARRHMKGSELRAAFRQMAEAVAALHTIQFPAYGELKADGTVVSNGSYLAAIFERATRQVRDERYVQLFLDLLQTHAEAFAELPGPALCHDDLNPGNLVFDRTPAGWKLAGVLDFDNAWSGCPESDIARLELWRGMAGAGFHEAYERVIPRSHGYSRRRPIYQLLWCLEYARSTSQHHADTAQVCAELGIEPLEFR